MAKHDNSGSRKNDKKYEKLPPAFVTCPRCHKQIHPGAVARGIHLTKCKGR